MRQCIVGKSFKNLSKPCMNIHGGVETDANQSTILPERVVFPQLSTCDTPVLRVGV